MNLEEIAQDIERHMCADIARHRGGADGHVCRVRAETLKEVDFLSHMLMFHTPLNDATYRLLMDRYIYCTLTERYGKPRPTPEAMRWPL